MSILIRKRYLRLVRKVYRFLRSPHLKNRNWLQKVIKPMFDRELWHPCRETVSSGLSTGLFFSMLPIPGQMILAAITSVKFRANIPLSIASCWVTNPLTQVPIIVFQEQVGDFLQTSLGIEIHPILQKLVVTIPKIGTLNAGNFILGFLAMAILLALMAYPVIYLLSAMVPKLIPKNRYQRAKAKIIAKMESQNSSNSSSHPH